ncbi:formate dehydrogenase accessory protein FdhE [Bacillus sp. T33-2]|uniref:formate dehydrogenase accessory protein FdhE n=1 Tax=Bacillus sp. T33-2 TaxID=2054168 RepID=UPI000C776D76|nr:formate dehydrogenase accessory protein FdhE [Bacillus sp. T33-2]PLR96569.1 formate dehydrogenase accessory protein FdhE [Bacillus sp. T33-2]
MKTSVVSKEYQQLQKQIINLQEQWKNSLNPERVTATIDKAALAAGVPAAALADIHFDIPLFLQWIDEVSRVLAKHNPGLEDQLGSLRNLLNEDLAALWIDEALALNHVYFAEFAEANQLDEWVPQFVAETASCPYLQLVAETVQEKIHFAVPGAGCPVCGEPVRLAQLEGEGQKVVHCPRCLVHWNDKRLTCSHCGNDDHKTIEFLTVEGDAASQIQVCGECNGYTKIIDTRQFISKQSPGMLDLTTIHLDFVAQENGYRAAAEKKIIN